MNVWTKIEKTVEVQIDIQDSDDAPAHIRQRYTEHNKGDFIFWLDKVSGTTGCIFNGRSITMNSDEISVLELQEVRPGKGPGHASLCFISADGVLLGGIYSNQASRGALKWLSSLQPILAETLGLKTRFKDMGCDT